MDKIINLKINGMDVSVPAGTTILEAARQVGNAFCSDLKEINITHDIELIAGHFETTEGKMSKLQKGNIKADRNRSKYAGQPRRAAGTKSAGTGRK